MEKEEQQEKQHASPCMQKRRIKRNTKPELPEDLIHNEILTRLPAKYLVRFSLVCKSWRSLISNSKFVNSHLTRLLSCNYDKDEDLMIYKKDTTDHGIFFQSNSDEIHPRAVSRICDRLVGSINGLVCMSSRYGEKFCLWNPATAQLVEVDLPLQHSKNCRHVLGGFTWDHLRNDYKVVVLCHEIPNESSRKICIYSSSSASWTEVDVIDHSMWPEGRPYFPFTVPNTIVKGIPYYLRQSELTVHKFVVEVNKFIYLPPLDSNKIRDKVFTIVNVKNCLVGMARNYQDNSVDIYSLDDESPGGAWSKMYTTEPVILRSCVPSQCYRNSGKILIASYAVPLSAINRKIKETTELAEFHRDYHSYNRICFSYTPSLVYVQGMKSMLEFLRCKKSHRSTLKMSSPFCNWFSSYSDCQ
ncbi:hypothetical protein ACET3Z_008058 [Daucus carota]